MALLADLRVARSAAEAKGILLAYAQAAGFPVTDWPATGIERKTFAAFADAIADFEPSLAKIADGGFLSLAAGDWLTLYAEKVYKVTRNAATKTTGTVVLFCAADAGPHAIKARQLWFVGAGGNRYRNTSGGTLREPGFTSVVHTGDGTGTVTPTAPTDAGISCVIEIVTSGALAVGQYQLSTDGGETFGDTATIPADGTPDADPVTGLEVTFAGTFTAGDTYAFEAHGRLSVAVESEFVNDSEAGRNYVDATNTITRMITPLPGVTCANQTSNRSFTTVVHTGSGSGTLEFRAKAYSAVTAGDYEVEIIASGAVGVATFRYRKDAGAWSGTVTTAAIYTDATLDGYNIVIRFDDGDEAPHFVDGDTFTATSPNTWILTQGTDEEEDPAVRTRSKARWPALSLVPTRSVYELWARNAAEEVTRVLVVASTTTNNAVDVTLAGQAGEVTADVVNQVTAYIAVRKPETDNPTIASATATAITLAGTVRVQFEKLDAAQRAAQANLADYFAGVEIAGTVRFAQVVEAILRESGGEDDDVTTLTINGSAANLTLGATNVATWTQRVASALTWTTYAP